MTRILWHGVAPWEGTGYGTQCATWVSYFQKQGHEVAISACHGIQGAPTVWQGIPVFPPPAEGRGDALFRAHASAHKAELAIILYDLWPMNPAAIPAGIPVIGWLAADASRLGAGDVAFLRETGVIPVAISEHTKRTLAESGWPGARVIPHGIDLEVFKPPVSREATRYTYGLDPGTFAIGINSSNIDRMRKGIVEQMVAFARFHGKHRNSHLFLHTIADLAGLGSNNLGEVAADLGISEAVSWCDQYTHLAGMYTLQDMANWYGAMDVVSNTSLGEGFGLAAVEAQACGTPVILSDGTTGPQLAGPGSWLVRTQPHWNPVHRSWWHMPLVESIYQAYEKAWRARDRDQMRHRSVTFARQYGIETVGPLWDEAITSVLPS